MEKFLEEIKLLGYTDRPEYDVLRDILQAGLKAVGAKDDGKLVFTAAANGDAPRTSPVKVSLPRTHTHTHTKARTHKHHTSHIARHFPTLT